MIKLQREVIAKSRVSVARSQGLVARTRERLTSTLSFIARRRSSVEAEAR